MKWRSLNGKNNFSLLQRKMKDLFNETYMQRKGESEASTNSEKGKQVVDVVFDDQSSPMDKSDDEQFSKDT
jgi:hypothetical protein